MFDCAELLAAHRLPSGSQLAIVTNAGGPGGETVRLQAEGRVWELPLGALESARLIPDFR
jgi:acyl-CoA synthetase (NDP forming)